MPPVQAYIAALAGWQQHSSAALMPSSPPRCPTSAKACAGTRRSMASRVRAGSSASISSPGMPESDVPPRRRTGPAPRRRQGTRRPAGSISTKAPTTKCRWPWVAGGGPPRLGKCVGPRRSQQKRGRMSGPSLIYSAAETASGTGVAPQGYRAMPAWIYIATSWPR